MVDKQRKPRFVDDNSDFKAFRVSADELLGMCDIKTDSRYYELKEAYECTYKTEDFKEYLSDAAFGFLREDNAFGLWL